MGIHTELVSDLFINAVTIIASVTIGNLAVRDRFLNKSFASSFFIGSLCGLLGILLMLYSVTVSTNIIIDFRCIPVILMGIYFSYSATFTAAGIIGVFRIVYYGFNEASVLSVVIILLVALLCSLYGKSKINIRLKWLFSVVTATSISSLGIALVISTNTNMINILLAYIVGMIASSIAVYYLISYMIRLNTNYTELKSNAQKDFLTGLNNVRSFDETVNSYSLEAKERNENLSLLFIDIDFFKRVNDKYGHLTGDYVLKELAEY